MRHSLRFLACPLLFLLQLLLMPAQAHAHKVNVYGWLEGTQIMVESSFSNGAVPHNPLIWMTDPESGEKLAEGTADDSGKISFPLPAQTAHGLRLHINAGEGHISDFLIAAEELASAAAPSAEATAATAGTEGSAQGGAAATLHGGLSAEDIRSIVNSALDAKLGPIRRQLAAQVNAGPTLQDIVGGIGWILGIAGLGLYFKSRNK